LTQSTRAATASITVTPAPDALMAVSLVGGTVGAGRTLGLMPITTQAAPSVNVTYLYATNAPNVATVSNAGVVTGVSPGSATITVTATGSGAGFTTSTRTATAGVTVTAAPDALTSVSLSGGSVVQGQVLTLAPSPSVGGSGVNVTYAYSSSAPSVASVQTTSGVVTGVSPGSATITVTATGSGAGFTTSIRTATASITVTAAPDALTAVSLNGGTIGTGQLLQLTPTPTRASAAVSVSYAYSSNGPSVASVNANTGVVTGVSPGSATITVTATGSGAGFTMSTRTATAGVTVTAVSAALGVGFGAEQFAAIPAGSYLRGSTNGFSDEQPVRRITISALRMQRTEVTQAQWRQVMTGTALANPSGFSGCDACPVETVSWDDIQQFLTRLNTQISGQGFRLPTEAEWEYAARATTTGDYGGSGNVLEMGWIGPNSGGRTQAVGGKVANWWGLYDMHGNVWEWVSDWYDGAYYATSPSTNPQGPASSPFSFRVVRGGSWSSNAVNARSASRGNDSPSPRNFIFGFRLARTT